MASEPTQWTCGKCNYINVGPICTHCGDVPTPDPRATLELLTELESIYERTKGKTYSLPLQVTDEVRVFFKLDAIIRDLRRLVEVEGKLDRVLNPKPDPVMLAKTAENIRKGEYKTVSEILTDEIRKARADHDAAQRRLAGLEAAAQAVCDPEVKRWSGVYSGEPWHSVPGELLTALANALAHREGQ